MPNPIERFITWTRQICASALTGKDNTTFDVVKILLVLGVLAFIVYAGIHVFTNGQWDPIGFGAGFGGLLTGGGASLNLKHKTEPEPVVSEV